MSDRFSLQGKNAVVTGGMGLLGKAFAVSLQLSGAKVYCADLPECEETFRNEWTSGFTFLPIDISSEGSINSAMESVLQADGSLDIWINNAYPRTSDWGLNVEKVPGESIQKNVNMHMNGYFLCCRQAALRMKQFRSGSIINIASIYGIVGPDFSVYEGTEMTMPAAYAMIKGGIVTATKYLASYYGEYNVRVNCISPGGIFNNQPESFVKRYSEKCPMKRMGTPDDIADAVVFLASDSAAYITGHNLVIDGGWTII